MLAQTQRRSLHVLCPHRYLCQPNAWAGKKQQISLTSPPAIQPCWPALIAFPSPHALLLWPFPGSAGPQPGLSACASQVSWPEMLAHHKLCVGSSGGYLLFRDLWNFLRAL